MLFVEFIPRAPGPEGGVDQIGRGVGEAESPAPAAGGPRGLRVTEGAGQRRLPH